MSKQNTYDYRYVKISPRHSTKNITSHHQHWCRQLEEPFTEQQEKTLQWVLDASPTEQRKYVIIDDKIVECCVNRQLYRKHHEHGWCKVTAKGTYIRVNG